MLRPAEAADSSSNSSSGDIASSSGNIGNGVVSSGNSSISSGSSSTSISSCCTTDADCVPSAMATVSDAGAGNGNAQPDADVGISPTVAGNHEQGSGSGDVGGNHPLGDVCVASFASASANHVSRDVAIGSASGSGSCAPRDLSAAPTGDGNQPLGVGSSNATNYHQVASSASASIGPVTRDMVSAVPPPPVSAALHRQHQQQPPRRVADRPTQPIICVPNQQAPYPHIQPHVRVGKAPTVVKQMTTTPTTTQRAVPTQQHVHVHHIKHKPHFGVHSQQQQVASVAGPSQLPARQLQPSQMLPSQRMTLQVGSSRSHISAAQLAAGSGRSQFPHAQVHSQKPLSVQGHQHSGTLPRSMAAQQTAILGHMSASASPHPPIQHHSKSLQAHQHKVGQPTQSNTPQNNGSLLGKSVPPWLPQIPQGASNATGNTANETHGRDRVGDNMISVIMFDRKVRLISENDTSSLYSLCRRWVRNDIPRKDQVGFWDCVVPLPRPLSMAEVEKAELPCKQNGDSSTLADSEMDFDYPVEKLTESELLQHHINHFKNVRKRSREQRMQRVARFKPRLALLLPPM